VLSYKIKQNCINNFAVAVGASGRIHIDPQWAKPRFGSTFAHGFLIVAPVSEIMLSICGPSWFTNGKMSSTFIFPAKPDDVITTSLEITKIQKNEHGQVEIFAEYDCKNQDEKVVTIGLTSGTLK